MRAMRILLVAGLSALVLAAASPARGDQTNPPPPRANRPVENLPPGVVAEMLDSYALMQAQEALQLNDSQFGSFVIRLRKLQQTRRQNQRARLQILADLRRLANPPAPPAGQAAPAPDENAI